MSKFLIHIHSGPDLKNKATLGMLVAITAFKKGNEVNIFLAADGTHLLNIKSVGVVVGQGTGDLKNHLDELKQNNIKNIQVIEVPGTWELVHATNALLEKYECDGVITIGVIIRGETSHYDLISQNVVSGLMNLALNTSKPVTLGILATENEAQAEERSNPNKLNKGKEFAQTILEVLNLNI